ncbi:MAG: AAA family ATPase [Candidatus Paraimprobicoccus trichonymphae]|uniref:AAA family ATPase n=1 Tax=Candidatus Paraimprobicoccus trichonymphae TaxID=3033793 RepID=A0AA48KZ29_9FIRM|nr:MAG: AAA family ATPase [Candidatus Paraimprobicoccus trichonymphae]
MDTGTIILIFGNILFTGLITLGLGFGPKIINNIKMNFSISHKKANMQYSNIFDKFDKTFSVIKGQRRAKLEFKKETESWVASKTLGTSKGGKVIGLCGPSGCGKTFFTLQTSKLFQTPWISVNYANVSHNDKICDKQAIFKEKKQKFGQVEIFEPSKLFVQLKKNPKIVLLIDEFEKFDSSIQELVWDILDYGYTTIDGEKLDLSTTLVLFTCNSIDKFDTIFRNRIKIIEFENLNATDYIDLLKSSLEITVNNFYQIYKIPVKIDSKSLVQLSENLTKVNSGARRAHEYVERAGAALLDYIEFNKNNDKFDNKRVILSYNYNNDEFQVITDPTSIILNKLHSFTNENQLSADGDIFINLVGQDNLSNFDIDNIDNLQDTNTIEKFLGMFNINFSQYQAKIRTNRIDVTNDVLGAFQNLI